VVEDFLTYGAPITPFEDMQMESFAAMITCADSFFHKYFCPELVLVINSSLGGVMRAVAMWWCVCVRHSSKEIAVAAPQRLLNFDWMKQ